MTLVLKCKFGMTFFCENGEIHLLLNFFTMNYTNQKHGNGPAVMKIKLLFLSHCDTDALTVYKRENVNISILVLICIQRLYAPSIHMGSVTVVTHRSASAKLMTKSLPILFILRVVALTIKIRVLPTVPTTIAIAVIIMYITVTRKWVSKKGATYDVTYDVSLLAFSI